MEQYNPQFRVSSKIVKYLTSIEKAKEAVEGLQLPFDLELKFRKEAFLKSTHYSTKIEGNALTMAQTKKLLDGQDVVARERDKKEVLNYYDCLEFILKSAKQKQPVTEKLIQEIHSINLKGIFKGKLRGHYREAQNVVMDSSTKGLVYMPPEVKDVGPLMQSLVGWLNREKDIHPVIKAAVAHYQFVTIHPFMDGNGRTARALATYILYHAHYDLKQFISLEEFYSEDRSRYYKELHNCQGPNYYDRPQSDITSWLEYFIYGVAVVFEEVKNKAMAVDKKIHLETPHQNIELLENIGARERKLLQFFKKEAQLKTKDVGRLFRIKDRSARDLIRRWIAMGLVERKGTGDKNAYYVLNSRYRDLINP
ncbi:MAG: Fic family protein [Candidatus Omnitrophica bacterium]|nr:Fic family protein [Candidatus Omnitrophota bacterium]